MRRAALTFATAAACAVATGSSAWAQDAQSEREPMYLRRPVPAPRNAFEIQIDTGYTLPVGSIREGLPMGNVADSGAAFGLDMGWRINPRWSLAFGGQFHESAADDQLGAGARVRGGTAGVDATFHILPYQRVDPYLSLGTGYRLLWELPGGAGNDVLIHGFELARAQVGADVRVSKDVAVGPVIGADVNMFMWTNPEGPIGDTRIEARRVSTFLFAGVAGRFDIGGSRDRGSELASGPSPYFQSEVAGQSTGVRVDPEILRRCGINRPAAYFDFDSTAIQGGETDTLRRVGDCLTTGPLRGRSIEVIGHTDPRGTHRYNAELGQWRANEVGAYLARHGVSKYEIRKVSRGEKDAVGTDPEGWAYDRRVDIVLLK